MTQPLMFMMIMVQYVNRFVILYLTNAKFYGRDKPLFIGKPNSTTVRRFIAICYSSCYIAVFDGPSDKMLCLQKKNSFLNKEHAFSVSCKSVYQRVTT
jgi:hypothetical protein